VIPVPRDPGSPGAGVMHVARAGPGLAEPGSVSYAC